MKEYDSNYINVLTGNGVVAFMPNRFDNNSSSFFTYNKEGLIVWNAESRDLAESDMSYAFRDKILIESFGVRMKNLGGDYFKYNGFLKQALASSCFWNLYKKNGQDYCLAVARGSYCFGKIWYSEYYAPKKFKDEDIQTLIENVMDKSLAEPFGENSWKKIKDSTIDRPDWESY